MSFKVPRSSGRLTPDQSDQRCRADRFCSGIGEIQTLVNAMGPIRCRDRRRKGGERRTERSRKRGQFYHRCAQRDDRDESDLSHRFIDIKWDVDLYPRWRPLYGAPNSRHGRRESPHFQTRQIWHARSEAQIKRPRDFVTKARSNTHGIEAASKHWAKTDHLMTAWWASTGESGQDPRDRASSRWSDCYELHSAKPTTNIYKMWSGLEI